MRTILLGPWRFTIRATAALRSLDTDGPVAVINPGWEEREDATGELDAALDHRSVHLRLFHRFTDVLEKDSTFAAGGAPARPARRTDRALSAPARAHSDGVYAVQRRLPASPRPGATPRRGGLRDAVGEVRRIDDWYLARLRDLHAEFAHDSAMATSEVIGWHREELRAVLGGCVAVVLPAATSARCCGRCGCSPSASPPRRRSSPGQPGDGPHRPDRAVPRLRPRGAGA